MKSVLVIDSEKWWSWTPPFGLRSHEDLPGVEHHQAGLDLLDPSVFLSGYRLEAAGEATIAGRDALRVRVRMRPGGRFRHHDLQDGIDEAELLLDAERGLILCKAELLDGQEAAVTEIEEITYDLTIPAEKYVFELPPGASGKSLREPQATTVDQAATLASRSSSSWLCLPTGGCKPSTSRPRCGRHCPRWSPSSTAATTPARPWACNSRPSNTSCPRSAASAAYNKVAAATPPSVPNDRKAVNQESSSSRSTRRTSG
jgi:hypothetical protein